jgi:DnaJ-class molecular chaperone
VHSHQYEPESETLSVRFNCSACKGGKPSEGCPKCHGTGHTGTYVYPGIPVAHYAQIRDAKKNGGSVGKTFHELIKKPKKLFTFTPHGA